MLLAMLALTVIYRVARPQEDSMRNVLPGAMVATLLWWLVDVLFGVYVRRVPYSVVYGGVGGGVWFVFLVVVFVVVFFFCGVWEAGVGGVGQRGVGFGSKKLFGGGVFWVLGR